LPDTADAPRTRATDAPKLGIITFHTSHNEGAVLQSLALSTFLAGLLPEWRVEIVDLYYATKQEWYRRQQNARGAAIEAFARSTLPLGSRQFVLNGNAESALQAVSGEYQGLVYGSDEIWKLHYRRYPFLWPRQNNPICPAFPNAYWPNHKSGVPQIAYAVSIGGTIADRIPGRHRTLMREMVGTLALLGVRDRESWRFVEWLAPTLRAPMVKVPDPTFAVSLVGDAEREAVRRKLTAWGVDFERSPVAVLARSEDTVAPILRSCRTRGHQTVALTLPLSGADVDLHAQALNPVEWMAALGLFSFCVSERMHACISCLLGGTPVVALDYLLDAAHPGSKLQDLFADFGLSSFHHAAKLAPPEKALEAFERAVEGGWPREHVRETLQVFRDRSLEFGHQVRSLLS
jgi:hypothetical protein